MTMSSNPTRIEADDKGSLSLTPGDDAMGDLIRDMSENEIEEILRKMLINIKRSQFRVIEGGEE